MTEQTLRELLERLHAELEQTEVTDEVGRERLRHLDADIRALLARSGEPVEQDEPLLERLQEDVDHFAASHPTLSTMISQMATILSNAGI